MDNERGCREAPVSAATPRCRNARPSVAAAAIVCLLLIGSACDNTMAADATATRSSTVDAKGGGAASAPSPAAPETAATGSIRCGAPSAPVDVDPDGDLIEADVPGSNGTRMFRRDRQFQIAMTTRAARDDTLTWQIRDSWDTVRASGSYAVAHGAHKATLKCTSTLAGYFAVSASLASERGEFGQRGTRPAGIVTFGVLPDVSPALPPVRFARGELHRFGGQGAAYLAPGQRCCDGDGYRPLYTDLGLSWANDNRNWYIEEPKGPNTFDPATKQLAPWFRAGDITRLIQLDGIPGWASPTGTRTHSYAPRSYSALRDYMVKVGTESNRVRAAVFPNQTSNYYQVTWEPDADGGLPWRDTDANFVAMYAAIWQGIHASDPNAVVMGVTYSSVQANIRWLTRLAAAGIGRYLDGVTIHGYYDFGNSPSHPPERLANSRDPAVAANALPAAMRTLRRVMSENLKPGAKLFVTETGISYDIGSSYGPHYPTGNVLYAQGAIVARTHLILLGEGADMTYVFYATDMPGGGAPGYGIFFDLKNPGGAYGSTDISPKPAALAVAAMTRIVDGTVTLGPLKGVPEGVYAYAFEQLNGGRIVTALWSHDNAKWNTATGFDARRSATWRLQVDAPGRSGEVTVFDMMGNPSTLPYRDGVVTLALTASPIYVVSANAAVMKANAMTPAGYVAQ